MTESPGHMGRIRTQQPSEGQKMDESPFGKGGLRGIIQPGKNRRINSQNGFALVAAILACVILFALAMLVIHLSTQDIRSSAKNVGDKKASSAAETGIHQMMNDFDPASATWTAANNYTQNCTATSPMYIWQTIASGADANSQYTKCAPTRPINGPAFLPMTGYSIGGGQSWGQSRYVANVIGRNTAYGTSVTIGTGFGYGPIEISTMSR